MKKYRVMIVGMGKRGMHHAAAFLADGSFEIAGICDIDESRLQAAGQKLGNPPAGNDARAMAEKIKPDVFCFCTLPKLRLEMVDLGIRAGAKLIAFEKPVALSSAEAMKIKHALDKAGVRAVVSHQHRYGEHYRKVKEIISSGALGRVHTLYATASGWMMHMMSHLIDYLLWFNDGVKAEWAMAQAAGRGKLGNNHPSPDYIAGIIHFSNGVHGVIECGAGAPDVPEVDYWWRKCRMGALGTEGFAEVLTGGGWRAVTARGGLQHGPGCMNYDLDMPPYVRQMAEWLDNEKKVHPCNFASAYEGFEIMMALCRSAAGGGQVSLPLVEPMDELAMLEAKLPMRKVILSSPLNAKEYN